MKPRRVLVWFVVLLAYFVGGGLGLAWLGERSAGGWRGPLLFGGTVVLGLVPVVVARWRAVRRGRVDPSGAAYWRAGSASAGADGGLLSSLGTLLAIGGMWASWTWLEVVGFAVAFAGAGMILGTIPRAASTGGPPDGVGEA